VVEVNLVKNYEHGGIKKALPSKARECP